MALGLSSIVYPLHIQKLSFLTASCFRPMKVIILFLITFDINRAVLNFIIIHRTISQVLPYVFVKSDSFCPFFFNFKTLIKFRQCDAEPRKEKKERRRGLLSTFLSMIKQDNKVHFLSFYDNK